MIHTSTLRPPDPGLGVGPEAAVLDCLGGEPLHGSGFEAEEPEPDFDERS
jgi:hypothetical protein